MKKIPVHRSMGTLVAHGPQRSDLGMALRLVRRRNGTIFGISNVGYYTMELQSPLLGKLEQCGVVSKSELKIFGKIIFELILVNL